MIAVARVTSMAAVINSAAASQPFASGGGIGLSLMIAAMRRASLEDGKRAPASANNSLTRRSLIFGTARAPAQLSFGHQCVLRKYGALLGELRFSTCCRIFVIRGRPLDVSSSWNLTERGITHGACERASGGRDVGKSSFCLRLRLRLETIHFLD
jgi:hypothetical protein